MKIASGKVIATVVLLAMMAAGVNFAKAQHAAKPNSEPVAGSATVATPDVAQAPGHGRQGHSKYSVVRCREEGTSQGRAIE